MSKKPNVYAELKIIDDRAVLYLCPHDWKAGIWLSRFYLLHEDGSNVDSGAFGPVLDGKEYDAPVTLMLDLNPRTKRAKEFFEKLKAMKMPRKPRRKSRRGAADRDSR